jgi:hypothetical protein
VVLVLVLVLVLGLVLEPVEAVLVMPKRVTQQPVQATRL